MTGGFQQGGLVFYAIFAVSLGAWTLIVAKYIELRRYARSALWWPLVVARVEQGDAHAADALLSDSDDLRTQLLGALLGLRGRSRKALRRAAAPLLRAEASELGSGLGMVTTLGAVAPLLGLLGTVVGMIKTFAALAEGNGAEASPLASGISQALLTTQAGLIVALPIVLAGRYLRGQAEQQLSASRAGTRRLESVLCAEGGR